jgi:hypothetical protein
MRWVLMNKVVTITLFTSRGHSLARFFPFVSRILSYQPTSLPSRRLHPWLEAPYFLAAQPLRFQERLRMPSLPE